jgi:hypothetical protein
LNEDRELWREQDAPFAPSIHVTKQGGIGIDVGGLVFVMPISAWHKLAKEKHGPTVIPKGPA